MHVNHGAWLSNMQAPVINLHAAYEPNVLSCTVGCRSPSIHCTVSQCTYIHQMLNTCNQCDVNVASHHVECCVQSMGVVKRGAWTLCVHVQRLHIVIDGIGIARGKFS